MSFVSSSATQFRPIPYHQAHRGVIPTTFGNGTKATPAQVAKVVDFVNNLNQDMTDAQIKSGLSGLIGPTFLPVSEHFEYKALAQITESPSEYSAATKAMAGRALTVLQNFYEDTGDFGLVE